MAKWEKFRRTLMSARSDANIDFDELCNYLRHLGFEERIEASHHKFAYPNVADIVPLQVGDAGKAKVYQVRQVRALLRLYGI